MKLYVMRHGPAEDHALTGRDEDRALTPAGRARTRTVARALLAADEAPLTIIASPLVRALQTAEIVAAVIDLEKQVQEAREPGGAPGAVEVRREMAPGGDNVRLIRELVQSGRKRAMIIGHEPDLSMLVTRLADHALEHGMLKSMVVGMKVEPLSDATDGRSASHVSAALRFILDPKSLDWQRA